MRYVYAVYFGNNHYPIRFKEDSRPRLFLDERNANKICTSLNKRLGFKSRMLSMLLGNTKPYKVVKYILDDKCGQPECYSCSGFKKE